MKIFCEVLRLLTLYLLPWSIYANYSFVFNPLTLRHYNQQDWFDPSIDPGPFAAACPSRTKEEDDFNAKKSLDGKALFVKAYSSTDYIELSKKNCDGNYQLAVAYHSSNEQKTIEFGYEIYFEIDRFQFKFNRSPFRKFGSVLEAISNRKRFVGKLKKMSPPKLSPRERSYVIHKDYWFDSGESSEEEDRDLGFMWIPKIIMEYSSSTWSVEKLSYSLRYKPDQILVTCENHNLGLKVYGETLLNTFYTSEHQASIFASVQVVTSSQSACKSSHKCVEKYNLVSPAFYFQASPLEPVSCSNLTTIPVWANTAISLLEYLDKFLVAITEIWNLGNSHPQEIVVSDAQKKLEITSGVRGVLALPRQKSGKPKSMYLHPKQKRFPIPEIIYKIVRYRPYDCNSDEYACLFDILIVIHNYPEFKPEDKLCQEDKCADWAWESIQYAKKSSMDEKIPSIYCCELDEGLRELLNYGDHMIRAGNLNLKRFPFYNKNTLLHDYKDKQEDIEAIAVKLLNLKNPDEQNSTTG